MRENKQACDIVIVNYNARAKVLECLASVFASLPEGCAVWVVDNDSSDGSSEAIAKEFPQARLIRPGNNRGFGAGCNLGAHYGKKDFIVFLNPDTRVEKGWLEGLLAPLRADAKVGLSTPKILLTHRPDRINACGNSVHFTGITLCRGLGDRKESLDLPEEVGAVSGAALAVRRELFESLGGFDEDMFLYMEDTDLSWRTRLSGHTCVFAPTSIVYHDYQLRIFPHKIFLQERNRYLMLLKNLKWPTLLLLLPSQLLAELIGWGFVICKHRDSFRDKWRAYLWIGSHWSSIMEKRKINLNRRTVRDREILKNTDHKIPFRQLKHGNLTSLARLVFNPLFFLYYRFSLALTWW